MARPVASDRDFRKTPMNNALTPKEQVALAAIHRCEEARQVAAEMLVEARDACAEANLGFEIRAVLNRAADGLSQVKSNLDYLTVLIEN